MKKDESGGVSMMQKTGTEGSQGCAVLNYRPTRSHKNIDYQDGVQPRSWSYESHKHIEGKIDIIFKKHININTNVIILQWCNNPCKWEI